MNRVEWLPSEKMVVSWLLSSKVEKHIMLKVELVHEKIKKKEGKMIEKGLIITGSDAELLSRALSEVKTKAYEESEAQLDDTQALDALVSCFRKLRMTGRKESCHSYFSPFRKRLVLGTIIERLGSADSRKA